MAEITKGLGNPSKQLSENDVNLIHDLLMSQQITFIVIAQTHNQNMW